MINVTRSFMPPIEEYEKYIEQIWESRYLTNEGPFLKELEKQIKDYLGIENVEMLTNGTIALELAIAALEIKEGEIITTPFSFIATTSSILWENCKPVFVDINSRDFCIDVDKIEEAITEKTKAILAVHVFGNPCDVDKIEEIAKKHNLKVIYDGAHAFGTKYHNKALLSYGDIATCSFHATKLFHTIEGGACFSKDKVISDKIKTLKTFGADDGDYPYVGTNGKMSEFNAAMGLANIKYMEAIIKERKELCELYDKLLKNFVQKPIPLEGTEQNYIYYPVVFESEEKLLKVLSKLKENDIYARRYFYPSLNTIKLFEKKIPCPVSEDISKRILSLPLYVGLKKEEVEKIVSIIKS